MTDNNNFKARLSNFIFGFFWPKPIYLSSINKNITVLGASLFRLKSSQKKLIKLSDFLNNFSGSTLNLRGKKLTNLPESLGNLTDLIDLDLAKNQLTSLPDSIGNLTNLESLQLFRNQLTSLPDSIGNLKNLTVLRLDENRLTRCPESLRNLTNLTELNFGGNRLTNLTELVDILKDLTNLKELNLSDNQLTSLPESFGNLTSLTKLSLSDNQLTSLPESFGNLTNLKEVDLETNPIFELPEKWGDNLREVYLMYNRNLKLIPQSLAGRAWLTIPKTSSSAKIEEKYCGVPLRKWPARWLLEERNTEMRRLLIQVIGLDLL